MPVPVTGQHSAQTVALPVTNSKTHGDVGNQRGIVMQSGDIAAHLIQTGVVLEGP